MQDDPKQKRLWRWGAMAFPLLVLAVSVFGIHIEGLHLFDETTSHYTLLATQQTEPDSPHVTLVGYATYTKHYGRFSAHRRRGDAWTQHATVLRRGAQYYTTAGLPRDYFRSLLDPDEHPDLARPPAPLSELTATNDRDAMQAALAQLQVEFEQ